MLYTKDLVAKKVERTVHIKSLFVRPNTRYVRDDNRQFEYDFATEDGKNWTMYYVDEVKGARPNANIVDNIYFVAEDWYISANGEFSHPPILVGLRYHVVNNEVKFVGAVGSENPYNNRLGRPEDVIYEMKLPDDVADELTHFDRWGNKIQAK